MVTFSTTGDSPSTRSSNTPGSAAGPSGTGRAHEPYDEDVSVPPAVLDPEPSEAESEEEDLADDSSRVSSVFSDGEELFDLSNHLDMTDTNRLCMIKMGRRDGNKQVPTVCGKPKATCNRPKHQRWHAEGAAEK